MRIDYNIIIQYHIIPKAKQGAQSEKGTIRITSKTWREKNPESTAIYCDPTNPYLNPHDVS